MKKTLSIILAIMLLFSAPQAQARHHHNGFAAFVGGLVLGSVAVAATVAQPTPAPATIYYIPQPVAQTIVVQQPATIQTTIVQRQQALQQQAPIIVVQPPPPPPPPPRPILVAPLPPRFHPTPPPPQRHRHRH